MEYEESLDSNHWEWFDQQDHLDDSQDMPENEFIEGEEEEENCSEQDVHGFNPYLGNEADVDCMPKEPIWLGADALNNTYVCIVHTNGIHHLAMVTCHCHREHNVALDLVAS